MFSFQNFVMPRTGASSAIDLYCRTDGEFVFPVLSGERRIEFFRNGKASFDTYFNALTVHKWKRNCSFEDVFVRLKGQGKFLVVFGLHKLGGEHRWLSDTIVELSEDGAVCEVPDWRKLDGGVLYISIRCISETGVLNGGEWVTTTAPVNNRLKLGVVVTHFNRKDYVLPAISRVKRELLDDPVYQGRVEMVVVDNSQNISEDEAQGVIVLPNKNLGGSGGFTRGLMYLKENSSFTHCLFMDDDASCEVESIKRAYNFLSYGVKENLAVSGGLLRELEPNRLYEKGAKFNGAVRPLKSGLNMSDPGDLVLAEEGNYEPDYGAWWFFAFPITQVKNYPFPFFVRGDDIIFGKLNDFSIETLNGVSCWGGDFGLKSSPMSVYLDVRNHLVHNFTYVGSSNFYIVKMLMKFFVSNIFSYNYASARSVVCAMDDFMKGPSYWRKDIDASDARKRVGSFAEEEKMRFVDKSEMEFSDVSMHESFLRKVLRFSSLNGFLFPSFMLKDSLVYQEKGFRANFREVFRHRRVLYCHGPSSMGYVAVHNKKRFFGELVSFFGGVMRLLRKSKELRDLYGRNLPDMTSENFWKGIYYND
ncbi:glycosyltransferase family 2 protein [Halomonas elongata]|uniref:glycosyltransferase family 2 protein n=1 Tax=Halomonas elongata TaxID=2746 RepID=UPI0038D37F62